MVKQLLAWEMSLEEAERAVLDISRARSKRLKLQAFGLLGVGLALAAVPLVQMIFFGGAQYTFAGLGGLAIIGALMRFTQVRDLRDPLGHPTYVKEREGLTPESSSGTPS